MIKIWVKKNNQNEIKTINISGHAPLSKHEKNALCSAVSAVVLGTYNTIHSNHLQKEIKASKKENSFQFEIQKETEKGKILLNNLYIQLKTINLYFKKNIEIKFAD